MAVGEIILLFIIGCILAAFNVGGPKKPDNKKEDDNVKT